MDAFLQGASFALFALEGRLADEETSEDVGDVITDIHEMLSSTREGLEAREPSPSVRRYIGKN